jgi:multidrug efflux pump subunit AcrA (membrane-fusion protein)
MERLARRRWVVGAAVLLGMVAIGVGVWRWRRVAVVPVARPVPARIMEAIASTGRVRGVTETLVGVQAAGVVEQLFVREGDRVATGQRVAVLKNDVAEARVAQAEAALTIAQATLVQVARGALASELEAAAAQVQQARAQLAQQRAASLQAEQAVVQARAQLRQLEEERDLASRQRDRSERLLERGLVARAEAEEAVTRFRVAEERVTAQRHAVAVAEAAVVAIRGGVAAADANVGVQEARLRTLETGARPEDVAIARQRVREAEQALRVARRQAQEAVVVAPFAGVVTAITAELGQTVGSQGVLRLVSTAMEIRVEVDESNLADLAPGQPAVVSSSTFPGQAFDGTVREIAAAVDQARGTVTVTVAPAAPPAWLRPGQTVNVNIVTNRAAERLLVPVTALRRNGDRSVVLVARDGRAHEKAVLTRAPTPAGVPLLAGLSPEDEVITDPAGIEPGDRVRPRPARPGGGR